MSPTYRRKGEGAGVPVQEGKRDGPWPFSGLGRKGCPGPSITFFIMFFFFVSYFFISFAFWFQFKLNQLVIFSKIQSVNARQQGTSSS
jgi:hypothetical protein